MKKVALITGITGQDGAYLAEHLLSLGYTVHGIKRRSSLINTNRIDHIYKDPQNEESNFKLHYGDLTDALNLTSLISQIAPHEIYNLGAMSHVKVSFEAPEYTANVDGLGTLRILEAVRLLGLVQQTRIYQASTSELYGLVQETPQTEKTPFYPRSPYGIAKLYAYWITVNYREAYNMHASNGILFNHESPLRGETFVTRKITIGLARVIYGLQECVYLGNLSALRDWGHAKDYVHAMHLMLQQPVADDYVIATGQTTSVRDFIILCAQAIGLTISFSGCNENEVGIIETINQTQLESITESPINCNELLGKTIIKIDKAYFRPTEVDLLLGDATKAKQNLGWKPVYTVKDLAKEMIINDIKNTNNRKN